MPVDTFQAQTGTTQYVVIQNPATDQFWNGSAFESFNAANWVNYKVAATEYGSTGIFRYAVPAALPAGVYGVAAKTQAGGSPAQGDANGAAGMVHWNGSVVVPLSHCTHDSLLARSIAGGADGGRTVRQALAANRNRVAFDVPAAGQFTVYAEDDTTPLWTGSYSRGSTAQGPLTGVDPA